MQVFVFVSVFVICTLGLHLEILVVDGWLQDERKYVNYFISLFKHGCVFETLSIYV